jgi:CTP:molybdopterin cytidylyltransferase MocA
MLCLPAGAHRVDHRGVHTGHVPEQQHHPVAVPGRVEARELHGDKAVWMLVEGRPEQVKKLPIGRPLPSDVDTWEDYEAVLRDVGLAPAAT